MKYENINAIAEFEIGDIIRHKGSAVAYVVTGNYGGHVTAVRTVNVTNATEWQVLKVQEELTAQPTAQAQKQELPPPSWPAQPF